MLQRLCAALETCGIHAASTPDGWRFCSVKARFADFTIPAEIERWDQGTGAYHSQGFVAHFPGTAVRIQFVNRSILLIFPSGHIRWMTEAGFRYYSMLSQEMPPAYCQGDVVVFQSSDHGFLPQRDLLETILLEDHGTLWYTPQSKVQESIGVWRETEQLYVGGNARHQAFGRLKYLIPILRDHRTVLIWTIDQILLEHDPIDEVHPSIHLPAKQTYLISKLPGFSDPVKEMNF